jgi:hypothetical protein
LIHDAVVAAYIHQISRRHRDERERDEQAPPPARLALTRSG